MLANYFVPLLLYVAEGFGKRLVKTLVGTYVLHTEGFGYSRQTLKLDDGTVLAHLLHLFAIFDVDVRRCVLLVMLHGETVTWWWTPLHT